MDEQDRRSVFYMAEVFGPDRVQTRRNFWIIYVLLMLVTLGVCLEGGSRLILSVNRLRTRIAGVDDASFRLQWIRQRKDHREMTGPFAAYHPIRGWILNPNIRDM